MAIKRWNEKELEYLKENYGKLTATEIAKSLERDENSIYGKARSLGLKTDRLWTEEEHNYLLENYSKMSVKNISINMNRSESSIMNRVYAIGIKDEKFIDELVEEEKHKIFMEQLAKVNKKAIEKLTFKNKYKTYEDYLIVNDGIGDMRIKASNLMNGCIPTIQSAINKQSYYEAQLAIKNPIILKDFTFTTSYQSREIKINIMSKFGELSVLPDMLFRSYPSILSAIDKDDYFKRYASHIHNNKYDYSVGTYVASRNKIDILCKSCNRIFSQLPSAHMQGQGCPYCNFSKGETRVSVVLTDLHIQYIPQYSFVDCRYISNLFFDFYLPEMNICIEYDGEFHYTTNGLFKEEHLILNKQRDKVKDKYCEDNNIKLIRIPYWEFDNIENILKENLILKE